MQEAPLADSVAAFLADELAARTKRNPAYSLRAFARDVGMSPSRLSEVINGGQGVSRSTVRGVCRSLSITKWQTEYLCDLADAQFARAPASRANATERLRRARAGASVYDFNRDEFQAIADWQHFGLLALMETEGFRPDPTWVGLRLGISAEAAEDAVHRLERLGLIEIDEDGCWRVVRSRTMVQDQTAPEAMRTFYQQLLGKAAEAIVKTPRDRRFLQATVTAIAPEGYRELVDAMREFLGRVAAIAAKYEGKREALAFTMQAFPLSQEIKE